MAKLTNEEKVAIKLLDIVNDHTINYNLVGYYLFRIAPSVLHGNLEVVIDSAQKAQEREYDRQNLYPLF
jgi:hypothetical protein